MTRSILVAVALVVATSAAHAQYYPVDFTQQTFNAMNISTTYLNNQVLINSSVPKTAKASTVTAGKTDVVNKLAASYPADKRAQAEKLFATLLDSYPRLEKQIGVPAGDLAGAASVLVIGSYEAYTGMDVDPELYAKVIEQVRSAMASDPELAKATKQARREAYEQMALVGMFMALVSVQLKQHPDPQVAQALRSAARGYLTQLGGDADRLHIGPTGLSVGHASAPAAAAANTTPAPGAMETVVLHTQVRYGYNGLMTTALEPVVLLQGGDALTNISELGKPKNPKHWTTWRKSGDGYELLDGKRWRKVSALPAMPSHAHLAGRFQHENYAGYAGGVSAASWADLTLDATGRFTTSHGGGSYGPGHASSGQSATTGGTYDISGYTVTLRHDDGRVETASFVVSKQRDMFWLDGAPFLLRK